MSNIYDEMQSRILSVIVNEFQKGETFDAHRVIEIIAQSDNDLYRTFCNGREGLDGYGDAHGRMSRILTLISERPDSPIEVIGTSRSANINGNTDNVQRKCFKKL